MPSGRPLLAGAASGTVVVLDEPLSFWGGFDPGSGCVVDAHHPQCGVEVAQRVLAMPSGRGSSSSSSVLAEAVRVGTAPAAILLREPDGIVVLGLLVAEELYGRAVPVVLLEADGYAELATGDLVHVDPSGDVVRARA